MQYEVLTRLGLTSSEVLVYTTLLRLGLSTTGSIVKGAGISSGKIYEILDRLAKKGLVASLIRNNIKHFEAVDPLKIKEYLARKKSEFKILENDVEKIIPELTNLKSTTKEGYSVLVYEGFEGLKTVVFEVLQRTGVCEWLAMGVSIKRDDRINRLWSQHYTVRKKLKIKTKLILSDIDSFRYYQKDGISVRLLESITPSPVAIVSGYVMIFDWDKESVIVIENERIATSFKTFFYGLWKLAKPK